MKWLRAVKRTVGKYAAAIALVLCCRAAGMVAAMGCLALMIPSDALAGRKVRAGGPCAYDEFPGVCTVSGRDAAGKHLFTFAGAVRGAEVNLSGNIMPEGMSFARGALPCKLEFIREGTCTPCVFSIGECGTEAWEMFRSKHKKARR